MADIFGLLKLILEKSREFVSTAAEFVSPYVGFSAENISLFIFLLFSLWLAYKIMLIFYVTTAGRRWKFLAIAVVIFYIFKYLQF